MRLIKKEVILLLVIIIFASFWRFYNYQNRWTLHQDQARDAVIGLYATQTGNLPLLGPPSSAGDFSFGPIYYWIIILFTYLFPFVNGPWIGFTILSIFSVTIFFYLGKQIGGLPFATISGLISAFTSASIFHAPDMLNPMLLTFFVPFSFLCMIFSLEKERLIYPFLLGFGVGVSINSHLQALGLIFLLVFTLAFTKSQKIKTTLGIILGLLIAFGPLIYFDLKNNGAWIKSIFEYLKIGQNKFNLIYSWLSDLKDFWPRLWGEVITNMPTTGYFFVVLFILALIFTYQRNKFSKSFWVIFLTFLSQIVILRYYKGPRLPVYLILNHSFIIFLVSWSLWKMWTINRILGSLLLLSVLSFSAYSNLKIINTSSQTPAIFALKHEIEKLKPEGNKDVYSYRGSYGVSLPLYYLWLKEGKINPGGDKIGVCDYSIERSENIYDYIINCPDNESLLLSFNRFSVFDLNNKNDLGELDHLTSDKIYDWINKKK